MQAEPQLGEHYDITAAGRGEDVLHMWAGPNKYGHKCSKWVKSKHLRAETRQRWPTKTAGRERPKPTKQQSCTRAAAQRSKQSQKAGQLCNG